MPIRKEACLKAAISVTRMKFDTINSPDGMTDRLIVSVGESKMSMAFRLKEIFRDVNEGESMSFHLEKNTYDFWRRQKKTASHFWVVLNLFLYKI